MAGDKDFEFQRLHGMGEALYAAGARARRLRLPHLCAGRQPQGTARLSGAAAPGERRQLVLRQCGQRSRTCRSRACSCRRPRALREARRRGMRESRCRRQLFGERKNSRGIEFGSRADLVGADARHRARTCAADRRGASAASRRQAAWRRRATPGRRRRPTRGPSSARWRTADAALAVAGRRGGASRASPPGTRRRAAERAAALERAADLIEEQSRPLDRAPCPRGRQDARRRRRRNARGGRFLPLLRRRGAPALRHGDDPARVRPARRTATGCAGAASSSASARGIFRSRFSPARSPRRSPPAIPSSPSPPSRRRSSRSRRCKLMHGAGMPADALQSRAGRRRRSARRSSTIRAVAGVAFTGSTEVGADDQPRARRKGRADRAADRRDRRHQRHDRRRDRAARAGRRRRRHLRLPLRRPALLRLPHPLRAGGRRRHDARR